MWNAELLKRSQVCNNGFQLDKGYEDDDNNYNKVEVKIKCIVYVSGYLTKNITIPKYSNICYNTLYHIRNLEKQLRKQSH